MKKLFLLISVLALSLMANATTVTIGPGDSEVTVNNQLISALGSAADGDIIILKDGIYYEASDYVVFSKNVEVRAEDGASPVIKVVNYLKVEGGKHVIIDGLTFDGSAQGSRDQYFRFYTGNNILEVKNCTFNDVKKNIFRCESGNKFSLLDVKNCTFTGSLSNVMKLESNLCEAAHFDGCEFSNTADIVIYGKSTSHLEECVVNDCYFHNNTKQSIYFEASGTEGTETCDELTVTNSTFANTTALTNWISVIDIRPYSTPSETVSDAIKVRVDHCTFYNNPCVDSGHANVRTSYLSDVSVSNCIFVHPTELAQRATYCAGGGSVSNCLAYNYTKDPSNYAHAYGPTVTSCAIGDPLFTDAANEDYSFAGDWTTMELSPARGAATDGSDLGDPRWYSDETLPSTSFASAYDLIGTKALLTGDIELNASDHIKYKGTSTPGTAKWKLHVGKMCVINVVVDIESGSTSGRQLTLAVKDADGNNVGSVAQASATYNDADINLGSLTIPEEGDYTFILTNCTANSGAILEKITLSYIGGDVQAMPGTTDIDDAWFSSNGTRTAGEYISIPAGHQDEGWVKWNVAFASAANYNVKLNVYSNNGKKFTVALQDADGNDIVTPLYLNGGAQHATDPVTLEMGAMSVPAGSYILKVTNAEKWSDAKLISVTFTYAGGGVIDFGKSTVGSLLANADAILSDDWSIEGGKITHAESKALTGWAKWNVDCADYGNYNVTVNISSDNGHLVRVEIFEDESTSAIYTLDETSATKYHTGDQAIDLGNIVLDDREYVVKVSNTGEYSHVQIASIVITYQNGAKQSIPGALTLTDAMLSDKAYVESSMLYFAPHDCGTIPDEWAKWNLYVADAGVYQFTVNVTSPINNGQKYQILIEDNSGNEVYKLVQTSSLGDQDRSFTTGMMYLASGNYTLEMRNVYPYSDGHLVSISAAAVANVLTIDENATANTVIHNNLNNGTHTIHLTRSFTSGMYNTICLPFDVSSAQLEAIFGSDVVLKYMTGATISDDVLDLNFGNTSSIYHGTPYLIWPTKAVTNPVFTDVEILVETGQATGGDDADFIGNFVKTTILANENNLFLGSGNQLQFSDNDVTIKGMRAYFRVDNPSGAPIRKARIVEKDNIVTELELIDGELQDIKSANGTIKTIENGQLILIRDGKRYNVMGIRF